jgi:hypothetical protein
MPGVNILSTIATTIQETIKDGMEGMHRREILRSGLMKDLSFLGMEALFLAH